MKRLSAIIITLSMIFTLPVHGAITPTAKVKAAATSEITATKEVTDLKKVSEALAKDLMEGNLKTTVERFSPLLRLQLSEESLKLAMDQVVPGLGEFIDVYEISEETSNQYQTVHVTLKYEYSGFMISFTYDASGKLVGLWMNMALIDEEPVETKDYKEIKFTYGEGKYPLTGILTLPKGVKKPPVVILVPGSGNHGVNEVVGKNRPFRDIAWGLAEKGIATIRYNERLALYQELLQTEKFTIQLDSLKDAGDAIQYALSNDKINKKKIFVAGHSLGGMMAPKLASDNKQVAGILILAGSPRKLEDICLDQITNAVKDSKELDAISAKLYLEQAKKDVKEIKALKKGSDNVLVGYPAHYWYSLNKIDIAGLAKKLKIPMFIAQGSEDWQVFADKDYKEWQKVLKGKKNVTFKLYDGLNHLFVKSNGKTDITEYNVPGYVDKKVINDMAKWIKKN